MLYRSHQSVVDQRGGNQHQCKAKPRLPNVGKTPILRVVQNFQDQNGKNDADIQKKEGFIAGDGSHRQQDSRDCGPPVSPDESPGAQKPQGTAAEGYHNGQQIQLIQELFHIDGIAEIHGGEGDQRKGGELSLAHRLKQCAEQQSGQAVKGSTHKFREKRNKVYGTGQ